MSGKSIRIKAIAGALIFSMIISLLCGLEGTLKTSAATDTVGGYVIEYGNYYYYDYYNNFYGKDNNSVDIITGKNQETCQIGYINNPPESLRYVVTVGPDAFSGFTAVKKIVIENTCFVGIDDSAFRNCTNLESITEYIWGHYSVYIKNPYSNSGYNTYKTRFVGNSAFRGCSKLSGIDDFLLKLENIGNYAFADCTSLTSISLNSNANVGDHAFSGCSGLTSVTIPYGIKNVGNGAFENCTGLTSAELTASMTEISDGLFSGCSNLTSITIPSGITSIGDEAFKNCTSLNSITIPSSVTSIGAGAFEGCTALKTVTMSPKVTSIGDCAFSGCSALTSIELPSTLKTLGNKAFYGCTGITSATFSSALTKIGDSAFEGCSKLATVIMPLSNYSNLTSIGAKAFKDCIVLTGDLLANCIKLTSIGPYAFENCVKLESITLPSKITAVNEYTFSGCEKLTKICVPEGVISIYKHAFSGCTGLKTIYLPKTIARIEDSSFGSSDKKVCIDTVWYGGSESYRRKHISIAGTTDDTFGNGYLEYKSEWIYSQTEDSFASGHQIVPIPDDTDDEGEESGTGNNGEGTGNNDEESSQGESGSFVSEGEIYYDYEFKKKADYRNPLAVMANAPKQTATGEAGSQLVVYTNITPTSKFIYSNGKIRGRLGKVVAGITTTEEKPYVLGSNKIYDAAATKIAVAKIQNGVITIEAKKEPGTVYLHVIDTGDGGAYSCIPIVVTALPKKLRVYKDSEEIKNLAMKVKESVKVYVKPFYLTGAKEEIELSDVEVIATLSGKSGGYFKVEKSETEEYCFTITSLTLNNGKKVKGKVEFSNPINGKKVSLTVTAE